MKPMRVLCLFANAFPFGTWEPYLETELAYYGQFDRVEIFSLSVRDAQRQQQRAVSAKVGVHAIRFRSRVFYAVRAVRVLFDRSLYIELLHLARSRRLSMRRLVQLVVFLSRTHHEADEVARIIRRNDLFAVNDDVVLYAYRYSYQPYLGQLVASKLGLRSAHHVARAHRADLYEETAPAGYIPLRWLVARSVDEVHAVAKQGRDYLLRKWPELADRVKVSYLGTVDPGLAPSPQQRGELRIVTCSTLVPVKRLDRLVEALRILPVDQRVRWVHFGDGPLREEIQRRVRTLPEQVTIELRGAVDNRKLLEIYKKEAFHALVNVSESEGVPVSMMEACAMGIPVIATDVGGVGEIIIPEENGVLLPSDASPEQIMRAITSLGEMSPSDYSALRSGARQVWERRFRADRNYPAFVSALLAPFSVR